MSTVVTNHALGRFREHNPEALEDDVAHAVRDGEAIAPELAAALLGRPSSRPGGSYVASPDKRGIFVLKGGDGGAAVVITYLRLGSVAHRILAGPKVTSAASPTVSPVAPPPPPSPPFQPGDVWRARGGLHLVVSVHPGFVRLQEIRLVKSQPAPAPAPAASGGYDPRARRLPWAIPGRLVGWPRDLSTKKARALLNGGLHMRLSEVSP